MSSKKNKQVTRKKAVLQKKSGETPEGIESGKEIKKPYPKWFYSIPFVIIIVFFILLEAGLRLSGYGKEVPVFTEFPAAYPGYLFFNPDVISKYFSTAVPSPIFDGFRKEKQPNTLRLFVLGESSAAGWPYHPNTAFPPYLRSALEKLYPGKTIEVVNLGVSAINTFMIRDIIPSVLEQKPDLILIYTGHNEYYGSLGVGSSQTMGKSRAVINLMLSLQKYRTVQLIQSFLHWAGGLFSPAEKPSNATLMERVVGESSIPYNSSLFKNGIQQFEENMEDILEACKEARVPVVLGNLACNLKDQKPLVVAEAPGYEPADKVYQEAQAAYAQGNYEGAKTLFVKARDLDALRFRAPSEINTAIRKLAAAYNATFVDVEGALSAASEHGIIGKDLMTDHLHPNIRGYQIIGRTFLEAMQKNNLLPQPEKQISLSALDNEIATQFPITRLDSLYADLRLRLLLGAYPFVPKGEPNRLVDAFIPRDVVDSLAMHVIFYHDMALEEAHYALSEIYLKQGDLNAAEKELSVLLSENILDQRPYKKLVQALVAHGFYDRALPYLYMMERHCGSDFSAEAIGSILLKKEDYPEALPYLEKAVQLDNSDAASWYNAAVAYYYTRKYSQADAAVKQALRLQPRYGAALALKQQLETQAGLK